MKMETDVYCIKYYALFSRNVYVYRNMNQQGIPVGFVNSEIFDA